MSVRHTHRTHAHTHTPVPSTKCREEQAQNRPVGSEPGVQGAGCDTRDTALDARQQRREAAAGSLSPSPTLRRVLPASTRVPVAVPQPEDALPGSGIVRRVSSRQGSRRCAKPLGEGARRVPWPRWLHVASSLLCSHAPGINCAPVSPTWLLAGCPAPLRRRQPREAWRAAGAGAVAGAGLWLHAGHRGGRSAQRARLSALGDAEAQLRVTVEGAQGPARRAG